MTNNIIFERLTLADAPALLDVQIRAFHDDARLYPGVEIGGPPGYDSIDMLRDEIQHSLCHKIMHDEQIVGGIVVCDKGDRHYHLDRLFIDPDYHNRGFGTQAMHYIEATYPAQKWTLDTPLYALRNQHFYEKLGYIRVGEMHDGDVALIAYQKTLGAGSKSDD